MFKQLPQQWGTNFFLYSQCFAMLWLLTARENWKQYVPLSCLGTRVTVCPQCRYEWAALMSPKLCIRTGCSRGPACRIVSPVALAVSWQEAVDGSMLNSTSKGHCCTQRGHAALINMLVMAVSRHWLSIVPLFCVVIMVMSLVLVVGQTSYQPPPLFSV